MHRQVEELILVAKCAELELDKTDEHIQLTTVKSGGSFGELALLYDTTRVVTAQCAMESHCVSLTRMDFREILQKAEQERHTDLFDFLRRIDIFKDWPKSRLIKFMLCLRLKQFHQTGQDVIKEGGPADSVFIIKSGEFTIVKERLTNCNP